MSYAQCTSLQGMGEDSLQTSFLDILQESLSNGNPTLAKSSENEPLTDGSQICKCGKGTFDCLIHPSTPEAWTLFMRDSLARILATPGLKQELAQKHAVASTVKSSASLAWFDQSSCSLKTSQQSLVEDLKPYLPTLSRSGMSLNGYVYALPTVGRIITGTDGFYWLTPRVLEIDETPENFRARMNKKRPNDRKNGFASLTMQVKYWPTPTAHNAKETNAPSESNRNTPTLAAQVGGKLNPNWVGWLMGFPIGWSSLKATGMPKSRSKRQQPTDCSEVSE